MNTFLMFSSCILWWKVCYSQYSQSYNHFEQNFPFPDRRWIRESNSPSLHFDTMPLASYIDYRKGVQNYYAKNKFNRLPIYSGKTPLEQKPENNFKQTSPSWKLYQHSRWWDLIGLPTPPQVVPLTTSNPHLKSNRKFFYPKIQNMEMKISNMNKTKINELQKLIEKNIDSLNYKLKDVSKGLKSIESRSLKFDQMDEIINFYDKIGQELIRAYFYTFEHGFQPFIKAVVKSYMAQKYNESQNETTTEPSTEAKKSIENGSAKVNRRFLNNENLQLEVGSRTLWRTSSQTNE